MTMAEMIRIHDEIEKANARKWPRRKETRMKFYFTFGSDERYPYGREDFVEVEARDENEAVRLFRERHPNRPGSGCVNCAFIYGEAEFNGFRDRFYPGREPVERIVG